eukprot:TRINITY_DN4099_c3_g1_i2.p1 TRINITY_DN4099_c3_g1~~TRINITY_DN4099_c3_g1_i2.p1  ORF type:complete len:139 (-),score=22.42 TRINITY_DN4099_c3_g1_i2:203-619(-)
MRSNHSNTSSPDVRRTSVKERINSMELLLNPTPVTPPPVRGHRPHHRSGNLLCPDHMTGSITSASLLTHEATASNTSGRQLQQQQQHRQIHLQRPSHNSHRSINVDEALMHEYNYEIAMIQRIIAGNVGWCFVVSVVG